MKTHTKSSQSLRKGFTLVELVVVVLVLGIIAATAAPKMFNTAGDARESSTKTSLMIVRDAIDLHNAQVGGYPGDSGTETDFKADLEPFLRGPFPLNQLPDAEHDGSVRVQTTGTALSVSGTQDWAYDSTTGDFIINTSGFEAL
jgi:general secretion pathway protein G